MEAEHFQAPLEHVQAPFTVIALGSIQNENIQIEKPSTKELTAWLLSKLHVVRLSVFEHQAVNVAKQLCL